MTAAEAQLYVSRGRACEWLPGNCLQPSLLQDIISYTVESAHPGPFIIGETVKGAGEDDYADGGLAIKALDHRLILRHDDGCQVRCVAHSKSTKLLSST